MTKRLNKEKETLTCSDCKTFEEALAFEAYVPPLSPVREQSKERSRSPSKKMDPDAWQTQITELHGSLNLQLQSVANTLSERMNATMEQNRNSDLTSIQAALQTAHESQRDEMAQQMQAASATLQATAATQHNEILTNVQALLNNYQGPPAPPPPPPPPPDGGGPDPQGPGGPQQPQGPPQGPPGGGPPGGGPPGGGPPGGPQGAANFMGGEWKPPRFDKRVYPALKFPQSQGKDHLQNQEAMLLQWEEWKTAIQVINTALGVPREHPYNPTLSITERNLVYFVLKDQPPEVLTRLSRVRQKVTSGEVVTLEAFYESILTTTCSASYSVISDTLFEDLFQRPGEETLRYYERGLTIFNRVRGTKTMSNFVRKLRTGLRDTWLREKIMFRDKYLDGEVSYEELVSDTIRLIGMKESDQLGRKYIPSNSNTRSAPPAQPKANGAGGGPEPMDIGALRKRGRRNIRGNNNRGEPINRRRRANSRRGNRRFVNNVGEEDDYDDNEYADDYEDTHPEEEQEVNAIGASKPNDKSNCFRCGAQGHWARECPHPPKRVPTTPGRGFAPNRGFGRPFQSRGRQGFYSSRGRGGQGPRYSANMVSSEIEVHAEEEEIQGDEEEAPIYIVHTMHSSPFQHSQDVQLQEDSETEDEDSDGESETSHVEVIDEQNETAISEREVHTSDTSSSSEGDDRSLGYSTVSNDEDTVEKEPSPEQIFLKLTQSQGEAPSEQPCEKALVQPSLQEEEPSPEDQGCPHLAGLANALIQSAAEEAPSEPPCGTDLVQPSLQEDPQLERSPLMTAAEELKAFGPCQFSWCEHCRKETEPVPASKTLAMAMATDPKPCKCTGCTDATDPTVEPVLEPVLETEAKVEPAPGADEQPTNKEEQETIVVQLPPNVNDPFWREFYSSEALNRPEPENQQMQPTGATTGSTETEIIDLTTTEDPNETSPTEVIDLTTDHLGALQTGVIDLTITKELPNKIFTSSEDENMETEQETEEEKAKHTCPSLYLNSRKELCRKSDWVEMFGAEIANAPLPTSHYPHLKHSFENCELCNVAKKLCASFITQSEELFNQAIARMNTPKPGYYKQGNEDIKASVANSEGPLETLNDPQLADLLHELWHGFSGILPSIGDSNEVKTRQERQSWLSLRLKEDIYSRLNFEVGRKEGVNSIIKRKLAEELCIRITNRGYPSEDPGHDVLNSIKTYIEYFSNGHKELVENLIKHYDKDVPLHTYLQEQALDAQYDPTLAEEFSPLLRLKRIPEMSEIATGVINYIPMLLQAEGAEFYSALHQIKEVMLPEKNNVDVQMYLTTEGKVIHHTYQVLKNACWEEDAVELFKNLLEGRVQKYLDLMESTKMMELINPHLLTSKAKSQETFRHPITLDLDTWLGTKSKRAYPRIRLWCQQHEVCTPAEISNLLRQEINGKPWYENTSFAVGPEDFGGKRPSKYLLHNLEGNPNFLAYDTLKEKEVMVLDPFLYDPRENMESSAKYTKMPLSEAPEYTVSYSIDHLAVKLYALTGEAKPSEPESCFTAKATQEESLMSKILNQASAELLFQETTALEKQYIKISNSLTARMTKSEITEEDLKAMELSRNLLSNLAQRRIELGQRRVMVALPNLYPQTTVNHVSNHGNDFQKGDGGEAQNFAQTNTTIIDIDNINKIKLPGHDEKSYVKTQVYSNASTSRYAIAYPLIDTGNLSGECLVSQAFWNKLHLGPNKTPKLLPQKKQLFSAGGSKLTCAGRAPLKIKIKFFHEGKSVNYFTQPLIMPGLGVPILLSNKDIINLKAQVVPFANRLNIPLNRRKPFDPQTTMSIPLRSRIIPIRPTTSVARVAGKDQIKIEAGTETHIPLHTLESPGTDVIVDAEEIFRLKKPDHTLRMVSSVDTVKQDGTVVIRVLNLGQQPVTINSGTAFAVVTSVPNRLLTVTSKILCNIQHMQEKVEDLCQAFNVNRISSASEPPSTPSRLVVPQHQKNTFLQKALELTPEALKEPKTEEEMRERLKTDLAMSTPEQLEAKGLSENEADEIVSVFCEPKYRNALSLSYKDLGLVKGVVMRIPTGDATPIACKHRTYGPHTQPIVEDQIKRWQHQGVISPADGPWSSPVVLVPKASGGWRLCIDYRGLNSVTTRDSRPVANMEEKLASIKLGAKELKYICGIDLSEAFHSVPIHPDDKAKTQFSTHMGSYQFNRMPFGLRSAPQVFQDVAYSVEQEMDNLDPHAREHCLVYFDDILLVASTLEEMKQRIHNILECLLKIGLRINPRKTVITTKEMKYLGVLINKKGIRPDPDRVKSLTDLPPPKTVSELNTMMGLFGTLSRFIKRYSDKTKHMMARVKKKAEDYHLPIDWSPECEQERQNLIKLLTSPPILGYPDWSPESNPFILTVDTSKTGIGCTISQEQDVLVDGKVEKREVILLYGSKKLSPSQSDYSSYKLELYGMREAVLANQCYFKNKPFLIRTDHKGLEWLQKSRARSKTPALALRIQAVLANFHYTIEYVPATRMRIADALSRRRYEGDDHGNMQGDDNTGSFVNGKVTPHHLMKDTDEDPEKVRKLSSDDHDQWVRIMEEKHGDRMISKKARLQAKSFPHYHPNDESPDIEPPKKVRVSMIRSIIPNWIASLTANPEGNATAEDSSSEQKDPQPEEHLFADAINPNMLIEQPEINSVSQPVGMMESSDEEETPYQGRVTRNRYAQSRKRREERRKGRDALTNDNEQLLRWADQTTPEGHGPTTQEEKEKLNKWRDSWLKQTQDHPENNLQPIPTIYKNPDHPGEDGVLDLMDVQPLGSTRTSQATQGDSEHPEPITDDEVPDLVESFQERPVLELDDLQAAGPSSQGESLTGEQLENAVETLQKQFQDLKSIEVTPRTLLQNSKANKNLTKFEKEIAEAQQEDPAILVAANLMAKESDVKGQWKPLHNELNAEAVSLIRTKLKQMFIKQGATSRYHAYLEDETKTVTMLYRHYKLGGVAFRNKVMFFHNRIVVPRSKRNEVISETHRCLNQSHPGRSITLIQLTAFWWFNKHRDVTEYVAQCDSCNRGKRLTYDATKNIMGRTSTLHQERLHVWSVDVIHLPPSKGPIVYRYLLVLMDVATSFPEMEPLRKCDGNTVATYLKTKFFPRYQRSLILIMDSGPEFKNQKVTKVIEEHQSTAYFTTPNHSDSQPVERMNRVIGSALRIRRQETGLPVNRWPELIPDILSSIRCMKDTTGDSPHLRVFGKVPVLASDIHFGWDTSTLFPSNGSTNTVPKFYGDPAFSPWHHDYQPVEEEVLEDNSEVLTIRRTHDNGQTVVTHYQRLTTPAGLSCLLETPSGMISSVTTTNCWQDEEEEEITLFGVEEATLMAQYRQEQAREKQRRYHDKKSEKRTPWIPITGVLVDCIQKTDQTSTNNRKMAMKLSGPFRVKGENNPFTLLLEKIDKTTFDVVGEPLKVHIKYVRPSVIARSLAIDHGLINATQHGKQPTVQATAKVYKIPQRRTNPPRDPNVGDRAQHRNRERHPHCPIQ